MKNLRTTVIIIILLTLVSVHTATSSDSGDGNLRESLAGKADLMVISAHSDDEFLFFGGTIPYYSAVRGKNTAVVYMTNCGQTRREETLAGLWEAGYHNAPIFLNLRDQKVRTQKEGLALWGGENRALSLLVGQIRKYRPDVIVTHDLNGEYGHNQHKITASLTEKAVRLAADPDCYPDSAQSYGTWQTQKLYLHLYGQNSIEMDWQTAFDELGGLTPSQAAALGFQQHTSQQKRYTYVDGGQYDNAKFGLIYTVVGDDTAKNDFFENIT